MVVYSCIYVDLNNPRGSYTVGVYGNEEEAIEEGVACLHWNDRPIARLALQERGEVEINDIMILIDEHELTSITL